MDKIKHTREAFEAWAKREGLYLAKGNCGWYLADNTEKAWKAWQERETLVDDMAMVLEMLAADADAGKVMIPSGLRLSIDAALIKAGRKKAPEPVRHITTAGGAR
ncbi:hypothetical protein C6T60_14455 [Burkholderia multivorans]|uniref:hypothetical protein n=1 Tax=Burkholderia multivorans TaxID=87883 RepID=UPI000CFF7CEE|nr:hypothetical protein [Burkholderia multivorans]PRH05411.1 hypothetical protein C6T60_14455 [Burkholderia multivorans]